MQSGVDGEFGGQRLFSNSALAVADWLQLDPTGGCTEEGWTRAVILVSSKMNRSILRDIAAICTVLCLYERLEFFSTSEQVCKARVSVLCRRSSFCRRLLLSSRRGGAKNRTPTRFSPTCALSLYVRVAVRACAPPWRAQVVTRIRRRYLIGCDAITNFTYWSIHA